MTENFGDLGGVSVEKHKCNRPKKGITGYTKEAERIFFFYATLAMFILYVCLTLFGD